MVANIGKIYKKDSEKFTSIGVERFKGSKF